MQKIQRGITLQTKISRIIQRKKEVMQQVTRNRKHNQLSKKGNTTAKLLLSHTREVTACFFLLFSLDFKSIKPIASKKMKNYQDIKKMQKKHVFSVSCFLLHHPELEDDT